MTYLWCIPYNWCNIGDHYRAHRRDIMVESEKKKTDDEQILCTKKKKHQRECVSNETKTATTTTTKPKKKKTDRKSSIFPNVTISHCSCTPYRKDSWKKIPRETQQKPVWLRRPGRRDDGLCMCGVYTHFACTTLYQLYGPRRWDGSLCILPITLINIQ